MAQRPATAIAWPSIEIEGNLLSAATMADIDRREAGEQAEADYGIRKGITIRDEIALAFRVGQAHVDGFVKRSSPSLAATVTFVRDFLRETFGFSDLDEAATPGLSAGAGRIPVVVVPPGDALDRRSASLSQERARSAVLVLQDRLNGSGESLWGLATNGLTLRLMRDNASLTRPAHIEADLAQIFATEDMASFAALWLLIHRSRFGRAGTPPTDCALERWREAGTKAGSAARDRLAGQVEQALRDLGSGFLSANPELRARLLADHRALTDWFNELLRLVYRLIFLMVAEDRELLHASDATSEARQLYAEGFGLANLRQQAVRRAAWDRHHDRYEGLKIVFRALACGEARLGLPALGGLFAGDGLPTLANARLPNRALLSAVWRLGWLIEDRTMVPINWRAMEAEELGSVYESLLELQPQLAHDGRALVFASTMAESKGNQRKSTGSYYTPESLVQALLDSALDPMLDRAESEAADPVEGLLALAVIDPACGSSHFLLAAARRIATRVARLRAEETPSAVDFRHALRDVARRCLYGVDRNPMAVELTKVALWIETVDPGLPLGFFDAQIRCGDSLVGVFDLAALDQGIPDTAYKPLSGDDKTVAKYYAAKNRREKAERDKVKSGFDFGRRSDLAHAFANLRAMPETTVEQITAKAAKLAMLTSDGAAGWTTTRACDLYIAAFLLPKVTDPRFAGPDGLPRRGAETVPTSGSVSELLRGAQPFGPMVAAAVETAAAARALHWPLEFPDVMAKGGFDVVLGNPPWERIKLQEQEFFAARSPEIAGAPNKAARERLIAGLTNASEGSPDRALFDAFVAAKREAEATSEFVRTPANAGGRFVLTGRGDVNTYALFAELFSCLTGPKGRAGVIVPTAIATDSTTAPFFAKLVEERRLVSLHDFQTGRGFFDRIGHARFKFSLLTLTAYSAGATEISFSFFSRTAEDFADERRHFSLSPAEIAMFNPNTKTVPVFRTRADVELTAKIYHSAPVLIDESQGRQGNPWGISFMAMLHMSNDSRLFHTAKQLAANAGSKRCGPDWVRSGSSAVRYVPLYEAKMIHQFDHRWASYEEDGETTNDVPLAEKQNPVFEPTPRYWVSDYEINERLGTKGWTCGWLMGWRDITNATNERTVIATVFPRAGANHKIPIFFAETDVGRASALLANFNALVFDYVARQKVGGTNLAFFYLKQLPVLPPAFYTPKRCTFTVQRVLELTYTSHLLSPFARDLGYDGQPFRWDGNRRAALRADLDAFYARAYGLDRDELRYILDPADVKGADYPSETFRGLKGNEIRAYGEYRTRRLVLEAWDRMEVDGSFKGMEL